MGIRYFFLWMFKDRGLSRYYSLSAQDSAPPTSLHTPLYQIDYSTVLYCIHNNVCKKDRQLCEFFPGLHFIPLLFQLHYLKLKHPPPPTKKGCAQGAFLSYLHPVRMVGFFIEEGEGKIPIFPLKKLSKFGLACKQIFSSLLSSLQNIF